MQKNKFQKVIVTGSLSYDHIMKMPDSFKDHIMPDKIHILNVGFLVNEFNKEFGGTASNVSYNLALLDIKSLLVASAGNDFGDYKKHLRKHRNIDISGIKVYKNVNTSQGFVITDSEDNQIWGYFQGAMVNNHKIKLKSNFLENSLLLVGPNTAEAMLNISQQAIKFGIPYMFDPAFNIPHLTKKELNKLVLSSHILIGNDYEIELIKRSLKMSHDKLTRTVPIVITTLGANGSIIENNGKKIKIKPAMPKNESDPTGAGDAYRAGFLAGYVSGRDLKTCGQMGSVCSVYTVEKYGTQTHKFTKKQFSVRYKKNFKSDLYF